MDSSNPAVTIAAFLAAIHADETLQRRLRLVTADDAKAVHNFDLCGWDAGELLWLLKNWDD